jgi:glycosyltransferase involved in cell wall biosynthesis
VKSNIKKITNWLKQYRYVTRWVKQYRSQLLKLDKTKKTVILVTHQISRTGAPILVLNLAEKLKKYYTVIVLSVGGGELLEEFTNGCDLFIGPFTGKYSRQDFLCAFLKRVKKLHPINCAVVNSIVSTPILKTLWANDIPSLHLIHEFSSYTPPEMSFTESARFSSTQIFSSKLILDNALEHYPNLADKKPLIIPQGRCLPPIRKENNNEIYKEKLRISNILRPPGSRDNLFVVIGLGTVEMRKGVDLFIQCAHKVSKIQSKSPIRFVWLGDLKHDIGYSQYLPDQIKRLGIEHICEIAHQTNQINHVYEKSDLLFLSSRLDPLPLVSQDMMACAKPVICFDKATGLAEFLKHNPTVDQYVVDYMEVEAAASMIVKLANDQNEYQRVGKAFQCILDEKFNLDSYVKEIYKNCERIIALNESYNQDCQIIKESGMIDGGFFKCNSSEKKDIVKHYLLQFRSGILTNKPFPGFHPGIYAERNKILDRDPLADYIIKGKPSGPWMQEIITPGKLANKDLSSSISVPTALHLHLYYADMAGKILYRISQCKSRPDLFISVENHEGMNKIQEKLLNYGLEAKRFAIVPNRGRDIGPLLTEFGRELLDNYEIIGHIHSKKSEALQMPYYIEKWANFLYDNLLGASFPMMDIILKKMTQNANIGIVYPEDPHIVNWGGNKIIAQELLREMGISDPELFDNINFPIGTMFWARSAALEPLFSLGLKWQDYPCEPITIDGTLLHAIERLLPLIVNKSGYSTAVTHTRGICR